METWLYELLLRIHDRNLFAKYLGMEIVDIRAGYSIVSMLVTHRHTNIRGVVHGGALVAMADAAMMMSCATLGRRTVTLDLNISFVSRVREQDTVTAFSQVIHSGSKTVVVDSSIQESQGKLLARARGTFFATGVYRPSDP
jgi:acyl-CoA thioesterase